MSKPNNHNKPSKKSSIKSIDAYSDLFILRERPVSEVFIERLAADMLEWAINNEDALKMIDFFVDRKISPKTVWKWEKKFPMLKEAKEMAIQIIGSRREKGAIKNKYNASVIMSQMAKYDPTWWKLEEKRAELRARTQQKIDPDVKYAIVVEDFSKEDDDTNNLQEKK